MSVILSEHWLLDLSEVLRTREGEACDTEEWTCVDKKTDVLEQRVESRVRE